MPSLAGLLAVLAGTLTLPWLVSGVQAPAAILTFVIGVLAFAIIPGMQTRVVTTAGAAPTLAVAVNASGFQLAAAFAGWLGGRVIADGPGAAVDLPRRRAPHRGRPRCRALLPAARPPPGPVGPGRCPLLNDDGRHLPPRRACGRRGRMISAATEYVHGTAPSLRYRCGASAAK